MNVMNRTKWGAPGCWFLCLQVGLARGFRAALALSRPGNLFLFCNAGVALLGLTLLQPGRRRIALFSLGAGLPGLAGLVRLATHSFFDLRVGGMERVSAYPFTLWIACMGAWLLLRGGLVA
jgi:hypothetical protein